MYRLAIIELIAIYHIVIIVCLVIVISLTVIFGGYHTRKRNGCAMSSPRLFLSSFSNIPVLLNFDVCSKCQRECLPKSAGKKKRLSLSGKEPERFKFLSDEDAKKLQKSFIPKTLRDRQIMLLKYFPNGRKLETILASNSVPTTFLNSLFLKICASGCLFS